MKFCSYLLMTLMAQIFVLYDEFVNILLHICQIWLIFLVAKDSNILVRIKMMARTVTVPETDHVALSFFGLYCVQLSKHNPSKCNFTEDKLFIIIWTTLEWIHLIVIWTISKTLKDNMVSNLNFSFLSQSPWIYQMSSLNEIHTIRESYLSHRSVEYI